MYASDLTIGKCVVLIQVRKATRRSSRDKFTIIRRRISRYSTECVYTLYAIACARVGDGNKYIMNILYFYCTISLSNTAAIRPDKFE